MARDYNRILSDVQNARDVFVTAEGVVEDAEEAQLNEAQEDRGDKPPVQRTRLKPDIFGSEPVEYRVSSSVVDAFHCEARNYPVETGGIVIGPDAVTVTGFIPSGPAAKRSGTSWELDVAHLKPLLEQAEDRGLRFLGIWHVHPDGVCELSATDLRTARRILGDKEYGLTRLLLPLSVRAGSGIETRFFLATGTQPEITCPRIALASNARPSLSAEGYNEILDRIRGTPIYADGCFATIDGPWARSGHFLDMPYGRERVARDRTELADAGWRVQHLRQLEDFHALSISREGIELVLLLPREYPFAPPDVIEVLADRTARQVPHAKIPETAVWSSLRSLATVAEDAACAVGGSGALKAGLRRGWLRSLIGRGRNRSVKALEA